MRKSMKEAIGNTVQDLHDIGIKTSFTKRNLNELGIKVENVEIEPKEIRHIREIMKLSQAVFADVLDVSVASVRQWEQGTRTPTGPTRVLFKTLEREPHLLDYRMPRKVLMKS